MWLLRISPTRNMRQGWSSRWQITALREKRRVCVRFLGRDSFANTMPTMNACKITPVIDWMHIVKIASVHSSVVCFAPYLYYSHISWSSTDNIVKEYTEDNNLDNCSNRCLPDRVLRLDGEEEATGEIADVPDAGCKGKIVVVMGIEVTVAVCDQPPYEREPKPG